MFKLNMSSRREGRAEGVIRVNVGVCTLTVLTCAEEAVSDNMAAGGRSIYCDSSRLQSLV